MLFLTPHSPCFLLFFILHGALFAGARPINSTSLSVSPRQTKFGEPLESLELADKKYDLIPFPEPYQGKDSDSYEVVGTSVPTILKVYENKGDTGERVQKEIEYSKIVKQYLASKQDDMFYYVVLKDVRRRYPKPDSPPLKLFHEWYLEVKNMDVQLELANLRVAIEKRLLYLFKVTRLRYFDVTLENMYTTKNFDLVIPINWAPPKSPRDRGVLPESWGGAWEYELRETIREVINVKMLAEVLHRHGERLRMQDGLDIRTRIELNDKEYRIKPLGRQGRFSETYNIIGGFVKDGATVPAVLKVTEGGRDSWKAEKEISYLQTVKLYLSHKTDRDFYYIVMKDVRVGFPEKESVPLKPFTDWFYADRNMKVSKSLRKLRKAIKKRLLEFAETDGLLYQDCNMNNIFVDQKFKIVMPIDWGPSFDRKGWHFRGVEEINTQNKTERKKIIAKYKTYLKGKLIEKFDWDHD